MTDEIKLAVVGPESAGDHWLVDVRGYADTEATIATGATAVEVLTEALAHLHQLVAQAQVALMDVKIHAASDALMRDVARKSESREFLRSLPDKPRTIRTPEYESAFNEAAETLLCLTTGFRDAELTVVNRIIGAWKTRAMPAP